MPLRWYPRGTNTEMTGNKPKHEPAEAAEITLFRDGAAGCGEGLK